MNSAADTENPFKRVRTVLEHVSNVFPVSAAIRDQSRVVAAVSFPPNRRRMNSAADTKNPFKRVCTVLEHVFNVFLVSGRK